MTLNVPLLDETMAVIEAEAEKDDGRWNQRTWRCATGMCFAGWAAQLSDGDVWVIPADAHPDDLGSNGSWVYKPADVDTDYASRADEVMGGSLLARYGIDPDALVVGAETLARARLGLRGAGATYTEHGWLFEADNDLEDLRTMVECLKGQHKHDEND